MIREFADICQKLLVGEIIDDIRYPNLYALLKNDDNFREVNEYLEKMARQCAITEEGGGFYLVYMDSYDKENKKVVKEQFEKFVKIIEPMVRFLQLCLNATNTYILTGERIEFSRILTFVDNSPVAKEELSQIVRLLGRNSSGVKNELTSVLDVLEKEGYLHALNEDKTIFKATAKWELFYEQIRYIGQCQNIIKQEPTPIRSQLEF